jgi:hypothetical protein
MAGRGQWHDPLVVVVQNQGIFCALYSDRASHFWLTPEAREPADRQRLTQMGRACAICTSSDSGLFAASPRGRGKHNFGTWRQGRLPQELRLRGITTVGHADLFLRERYTIELNRKFRVAAAQPESAFVPASGKDLERIFAVQLGGLVNQEIPCASPTARCRSRKQVARHARQVPRAGLRASGRHLKRVLRPAPGRPLRPGRRTRGPNSEIS